jgi:hypothetical protein
MADSNLATAIAHLARPDAKDASLHVCTFRSARTMASALTAAAAVPAARLRGPRRATGTRRVAAAPVRAAASPAVTAEPTANPMAGVQLFDVNGEPKTIPFWSEDQTVVVTFLRHFG